VTGRGLTTHEVEVRRSSIRPHRFASEDRRAVTAPGAHGAEDALQQEEHLGRNAVAQRLTACQERAGPTGLSRIPAALRGFDSHGDATGGDTQIVPYQWVGCSDTGGTRLHFIA
jgi:hypothetical protein